MIGSFFRLMLGAFFICSILTIPAYIFTVDFFTDKSIYNLFVALLFIGLTLLAIRSIYRDLQAIHRFQVIGYYSKRIGDEAIETWLSGEEIYKKMQSVDEICVSEGVATLTEFGFYDDFDGEEVIWHDAREGLITLTAIKNYLTANGTQDEQLLTEISKLEYALGKAAEKEILFSLLLRPVKSSTNSREWENRKGTCW